MFKKNENNRLCSAITINYENKQSIYKIITAPI